MQTAAQKQTSCVRIVFGTQNGMPRSISSAIGLDLSIFETLAIKLQGSAILSYSADDIVRSARRHVSFNFKGDLDLRIEQASKMLNHGSGYRINVPRQPSRIQCR